MQNETHKLREGTLDAFGLLGCVLNVINLPGHPCLRCWDAFLAVRKGPSGKKISMRKDKIPENASTKARKCRACGDGTTCRRGAYLGILFAD